MFCTIGRHADSVVNIPVRVSAFELAASNSNLRSQSDRPEVLAAQAFLFFNGARYIPRAKSKNLVAACGPTASSPHRTGR
ncbi:hypothetical protein BURKHO8Y_240269 [Burkholderia sp. 8Y]|nr:hypothetical protein BURKHO8Y_240269 [Burkholderia sp. 8Y]